MVSGIKGSHTQAPLTYLDAPSQRGSVFGVSAPTSSRLAAAKEVGIRRGHSPTNRFAEMKQKDAAASIRACKAALVSPICLSEYLTSLVSQWDGYAGSHSVLIEAGAVDAVLTALATWPRDVGVAANGLLALGKLASLDNGGILGPDWIVSDRVLNAIRDVILAHPQSESVLSTARCVLCAISGGIPAEMEGQEEDVIQKVIQMRTIDGNRALARLQVCVYLLVSKSASVGLRGSPPQSSPLLRSLCLAVFCVCPCFAPCVSSRACIWLSLDVCSSLR